MPAGRGRLLAVASALVVGLAACGGGKDSDEDQIRAVVETFYGNGDGVCDVISDKLRDEQFASKDECESAAADAEAEDGYEIQRVSVDGEEGTVDVQVEDQQGTLLVTKDDGDWKVDGIKQREDGETTETTPGG